MPVLDGTRSGQTGSGIQPGHKGRQAVEALFASLRSSQPDAGPLYWASRTWSLLLWQPVYLAVLSVHLAHRLPVIEQMIQHGQPGFVAGFCLPPQPLHVARPERLLPRAGAALRQLGEGFLPEVQALAPLHPKMAGRLLADGVLSALLLLQQHDPRLANPQLSELATRWLASLGLADASSFITVGADGRPVRLALQRKVCCQNFRCHSGEFCSTCPKLSREERLVRLTRESA